MENKTHWKKKFDYNYLGSQDIPQNQTLVLTIASLKDEVVTGEKGRKDECFICYWQEKQKPMILNKTNCRAITAVTGSPIIEGWIGHRVEIEVRVVDFRGDPTEALRIKPVAPKPTEKPVFPKDNTKVFDNAVDAYMRDNNSYEKIESRYILTEEHKDLIDAAAQDRAI